MPWKFHKRGAKFEPSRKGGKVIDRVYIVQTAADPPSPIKYEDGLREGYNLTIGADCKAVYITAASSIGVLHALTTLGQLFYKPAAGTGAWGKGPVHILDEPKFVHRGLNLDVARQWYPVKDILRTIDALSWNKMNRLHLHVTDSQSWPLEIPSMPGLAANGAYAAGLTYSPADVQGILAHAEARGVQVYVEIDMPGHTTSIANTYPELIAGVNEQPWERWAAQPPSGSLKLNDARVDRFVTDLFRDLLPRLNKHSHYYHTGGDEVNRQIYLNDEGVKSNKTDVIRPHLARFFDHVQRQVANHSMSPFVWQEMLLDWHLKLPPKTVVQTWISDEAAANATRAGFRVVAGNFNFWYLDCGHGTRPAPTGPLPD